jgi:hypothetical protein
MKQLLNAVLGRLEAIPALKYVDIDWGQMAIGTPNPVKYPACLVRLVDAQWANQGALIQRGKITVSVSLIALRLSNTSSGVTGRNPAQRVRALEFYDLADTVFARLHGWQPFDDASRLVRTTGAEQQRDGVIIFTQQFTCTVTDDGASPQSTMAEVSNFNVTAELKDN